MNRKRPDKSKKGGAFAPVGVKRGIRKQPLPVRRVRPKGGWPTTVKTERHGPNGSIAQARRASATKR